MTSQSHRFGPWRIPPATVLRWFIQHPWAIGDIDFIDSWRCMVTCWWWGSCLGHFFLSLDRRWKFWGQNSPTPAAKPLQRCSTLTTSWPLIGSRILAVFERVLFRVWGSGLFNSKQLGWKGSSANRNDLKHRINQCILSKRLEIFIIFYPPVQMNINKSI